MIDRDHWRDQVHAAWAHRPICWLQGVRRAGKTVLARSIADTDYYDCELPSVRRRESAVRLFDELLNETAVPRIDTTVRRSLGPARRIVRHDHPITICAGHPRAFARIGGKAVCSTNS